MDHNKSDGLKSKKVHPECRANFLSNIFFCWGLPIFRKGWKKELDESDLYQPLKVHKSERLGDKLEEAWKLEQMAHQDPQLWRALWKLFKSEIIGYGFILFFMEFILRLSQPLALGRLMSYYNPNQNTVTKVEAYIYAGSIVLTSFVMVLVNHTYMLGLQHLGMKMRIACCSLIYRKTLKLSKSALAQTTIGQMINLLSNDVNRFDVAGRQFHYLWAAPLQSFLIMYMLYDTVGITAITGFALLLIFIPTQMLMGKLVSIFRLKTAVTTDERVRLMNEIICGIQVIKMYTWEKPFAYIVEKIRELEIKHIRHTSYLSALHASFNKFITRTSVFLCILTYVLTGNHINAEYVYVVSSFYAILKQVVTTNFPQAIADLGQTVTTINRIEAFLKFDEVQSDVIKSSNTKFKKIGYISSTPLIHASNKITNGIYLQNASAKWFQSMTDNTLSNINFNVGPKQLVAIVGEVGSGKSSLLHLILKELPLTQGKKDVVGSISYASQEPWLFAGTVKQNILFGQEFDSKKYENVIKVCALEHDFDILPYGDRSLVGERGVTLSGGQRARINLARAIYKEADIYLLDDPLSAVDTHVGKHLFDECILGYLKHKCTVLVTHQLQYLKSVNKIYLMENGCITSTGTYEEIQNSETEFAKLFKHHDYEEEDDEIDEDNEKENFERNIETSDAPSEVKEHRSTGQISLKVYKSYIKASGGWLAYTLLIFLFVLSQIFSSAADYFISFWVNLEQSRNEYILPNTTFYKAYYDEVLLEEQYDTLIAGENEPEEYSIDEFFTTDICFYIYSSIIILVIFTTILRSVSFFKLCMKASIKLHSNMFSSIVNATMKFFNTNPSGRILNRFAKDMGAVDEILPYVLIDTIQIALNVIAINVVIASVNPWILISTILIVSLFYLYRVIYLATSRNLKRMEGTTRSPVFSHINASLQGITTIRAFGAQETLKKEFDSHQDLHSSAYYIFLGCNRTFGFWLDFHCVIYTAIVTLSFFFMRQEVYGGNVGLAITQALGLTGMFQWGMRQWSELENSMTSVERVIEYTEIDQESNSLKKKPSKSWPESGNVEFQAVYLKYSLTDPYVLSNLSFKIKPKEKVGIVGRTGAGKTSLIAALFRLAHIEGKIIIDGVNTKEIPLNSIRSKISIIPQEPVLFSGTIRSNLDPFNQHKDFELWSALDEVKLKSVVSDLPSGLDSAMSEGGSNFSVGQRQLICLARAIIRRNKILVMDEATANVDPKTDKLIQSTIRDKFADCTVLTIAHRLHTVMDSDKVLVMDSGSAVEFGHPHVLLQKQDGIFKSLVKGTGKGMSDNLANIAEKSFTEQQEEIK